MFRHVLKNALIPLITSAEIVQCRCVPGKPRVESFFGIPGLGAFVIEASGQDFERRRGLSRAAVL